VVAGVGRAGCDFADATLHRFALAVNGGGMTSHDIFVTSPKCLVRSSLKRSHFVVRGSPSSVRLSRIALIWSKA
jgi:hypothetical protein